MFVDESSELDQNFDEEIAEIDEMREEVDEARKLGTYELQIICTYVEFWLWVKIQHLSFLGEGGVFGLF